MIMIKRWEMGAYELRDNEKGEVYTNTTCLSDICIPFEDLLNRYESSVRYYRNKLYGDNGVVEKSEERVKEYEQIVEEQKQRINDLEADFDKVSDFLMNELDISMEDILNDIEF